MKLSDIGPAFITFNEMNEDARLAALDILLGKELPMGTDLEDAALVREFVAALRSCGLPIPTQDFADAEMKLDEPDGDDDDEDVANDVDDDDDEDDDDDDDDAPAAENQ